jgi:hypothetical protein
MCRDDSLVALPIFPCFFGFSAAHWVDSLMTRNTLHPIITQPTPLFIITILPFLSFFLYFALLAFHFRLKLINFVVIFRHLYVAIRDVLYASFMCFIHFLVLFVCFQASFYSTALKTLISVSTVILLGLIVAYHALEVQVRDSFDSLHKLRNTSFIV